MFNVAHLEVEYTCDLIFADDRVDTPRALISDLDVRPA